MPTPTHRRVLPPALAALTLVALAVASLSAQERAPRQKEDPHATLWLVAAGLHQPGAFDDQVRLVSAWKREHALTTVTRALRQSTDTPLLLKGLALHTDAAIAERTAVQAGFSRGTRSQVLDGQTTGRAPRSLQWEVGRLIANDLATRPGAIGAGRAIPDGVAPVRAWYRASSATLQQWVDLGALREHLEEGLRVFPTDATLLMYRGTLHQAFADGRIQAWVKADPLWYRSVDANGWSTNRADVMQIRPPAQELANAERDLRRALELEAGLLEARVRLAHVLVAKGEAMEEAAALARTALEQPSSRFLDYYASMVLGRAEHALGRQAPARAAFKRAAELFPKAQSARVALSLVALGDGRHGDGIAALVATNGPEAERTSTDPWWSYFRNHAPDAQALLKAFREQGR
jgi:hypothetical protein